MSGTAIPIRTTVGSLDDVDRTPPGDLHVLIYHADTCLYTPGPMSGGGGGVDLSYTFTQNTPASVWTITHNLGKRPSITVMDSGGNTCYGDVQYTSVNAVTITFGGAFSGVAYLN
jgi:hypothetical protein